MDGLRLVESAPGSPRGDERSDDTLMCAVAAGEHAAFRVLIERHQASIRRFRRAISGDAQLSRDLAQEVFLRLWSERARYRPEGRFKAYLFTLARNLARSVARRRTLRALLFGARSEPTPAPAGPGEELA